ncbi:helix-turn-helix domain-containing protein [Streptomyces sp. NPDC059008]|uniref:helix-turn-helix domain-containing protein n=1 Tax=Streptomyces sp. NPDC059008 TaxID=3346693 RepID=UPI0036BF785E
MATGTEDFAHLLRRLKERSGRSYGALAGQLHLSVSTLHRYCNGDAVPLDFAPVARLARLCGANREEMVELHRQWIIADEGRRRGRSAPAPTAPDTPDAPDADADSGADAAADADPPPNATPPTTASAESATAATAPTSATATTTRTRTPTRKRLRFALAALALVSLAVPAALALEQAPAEEAPRDSRGAARLPAAGDHPVRTPENRPAPAPSAAKDSPAPGDKGEHGSSASGRPKAPDARREPAGDKGKRDGSAPQVGVSSYNWDGPCGVYYLLQQQPEHVPPPPPPQDARGWSRALGGVDGGHLRLQLTATGSTDEAVVLTSLHVRVVGKRAALPWPVYSMGEGCGGGVTPQSFDIDLDSDRPTTKPVAGQDGDIEVPAKDFPFKVSTQDPQVFNLDLHTEGHDVSWYLELGWSSGDRRGTVRIDDGGKPFRTSAVDGRDHFSYWPDKYKWVPE